MDDPSRTVLKGREAEEYLRKRIDTIDKELIQYIKGMEREFSTYILEGIARVLPLKIQRSLSITEKQNHLNELHDTIMVLDSLIERNIFYPLFPNPEDTSRPKRPSWSPRDRRDAKGLEVVANRVSCITMVSNSIPFGLIGLDTCDYRMNNYSTIQNLRVVVLESQPKSRYT